MHRRGEYMGRKGRERRDRKGGGVGTKGKGEEGGKDKPAVYAPPHNLKSRIDPAEYLGRSLRREFGPGSSRGMPPLTSVGNSNVFSRCMENAFKILSIKTSIYSVAFCSLSVSCLSLCV